MATKTSNAEKPYFGENKEAAAAEAPESHLLALDDADKTALDAVRALTEAMNAASKMQETQAFDALADMRSDLLLVQQSLSQSSDELTEEVATAQARLDAHAIPSLEAVQQALAMRLEQGNVPDGVDANGERKAIDAVFGRVREGFEQLMPDMSVEQQPSQAQPQQELNRQQVGEGLQGRFAHLRKALSGDPQQQPSDEQLQNMIEQTHARMRQEGWTPAQGHARAVEQRRQAAAARQQEEKSVPTSGRA